MKTKTAKLFEDLFARKPVLLTCKSSMLEAFNLIFSSFHNGGKMLVCGNGGSASDSLHIVGELMKGFVLPRQIRADTRRQLLETCPTTYEYLASNLQEALPAISLVNEIALSTAFSNDRTSDLIFAQQVLGLGRPRDILFAISTSGTSANVVYAAQLAKAIGMNVIGLTGINGGELRNWADEVIAVPESETFKVQELHLPVYHALCLALEQEFFGE